MHRLCASSKTKTTHSGGFRFALFPRWARSRASSWRARRASWQRFSLCEKLVRFGKAKLRPSASSPTGGAKKDQVERLGLFLSIAKAMVYHHALACISSPKVYIISRRLYFAFAMMIYKAFRFDDMQFLAELMIYTPLA